MDSRTGEESGVFRLSLTQLFVSLQSLPQLVGIDRAFNDGLAQAPQQDKTNFACHHLFINSHQPQEIVRLHFRWRANRQTSTLQQGFGALRGGQVQPPHRSEEHTSELQSRENLVCRLLLEKKKLCDTPTKS